MQSDSNPTNLKRVRGWILDLYPSASGQMSIWVITKSGKRIHLFDEFKPKIYISSRERDLERLSTRLFANRLVASSNLAYKYAGSMATEKSKILEVTLRNHKGVSSFAQSVLEVGKYFRYQLHNCDLKSDQAYLYDREIFPLGFVEIEVEKEKLRFRLLDSIESVDYQVPSLRVIRIHVDIAKKGKMPDFSDPLRAIVIYKNGGEMTIDTGDEKNKLLQLVEIIRRLDPDIVFTRGGDSHVFPYLARRALLNGISERFVLSREDVSMIARHKHGTTYFSYGKTYYRAPTRRLFGRVHIDEYNSFIQRTSGLDGLAEIVRTCRVPLHRASRSSIGSSMASLQLFQAKKDGVLIPRRKCIPETFKSAYELLIGDRGGFVYEPRVGIHDNIGEVDFSSMYPSLMAKNNISAETVLCKCCPDAKLRVPELGYNICANRVGIVPKILRFIIAKRLLYNRLKKEAHDQKLKEIYNKRQCALKWILVTCFGYLGYRNAKFGTVDGHISVCAFGRHAFLKAAHVAEKRGFNVIHGIVDSLWLRKVGATTREYVELCREISSKIGVPLNFEGHYKWIVFLPSRIHSNVAVLNRYYGIKRDGTIKIRGLETRRRDTAKFVYDAQMEMIRVLATANDSIAFFKKIPDVLNVVKEYKRRLLDGKVSIWDLIITKRLSKNFKDYRQKVSQVIAAKQLLREGVEVPAGKNVSFFFKSAENKYYERRVKAKELIKDCVNSDIKKYLLLLYLAASNILSPFGYSKNDIYDSIKGHQRMNLTSF
ncbi:MAG: hypothetical protein JSV05_00630 [Candidatus Bathyarchaeota archaeon]|nr:MAG: hypothetical protein JSV05_00630 [Candidatus Bathyarchaeota archaeon]